MSLNLNNLLTKLQLESMCGLALYFIGFYVIYYFLDRYFKPTKKNYMTAVYVLGALVFGFLIFVFFRNLYNMKKVVKEQFIEKFKNNDKPKCVLFHAEWCGFCKKLKPHWDEFKNQNSKYCDFEEYEVDEDGTKDLMKEYKVGGFPTIFFEKNGSRNVFDGERTTDGLNKHLSGLLESDDEPAPVEDNKNTEVMLFHADWCGHCKKFMPEWKKFVSEHGNTVNTKDYEVSNPEAKTLSKKYGVQGFPTVVVKHADGHDHYKGERKSGALKKFVDKYL
tara:strand:- start:382 stop:1212 length:831 start_codon:yes stop_codon:yes gene_type:complete